MDFVTRRLTTGGGILSGQDPLEETFSLFLVQAVIIIGITRALSVVGYYLKQPRVIFEIIGGILLGPSAIGRDEEFLLKIFPHSSLSYIGLVANIGLTLYLFLVGMELDVPKLATHAKKAGGVAIMGMAVPFALGIAISKTMFDNLQADDPKFKDVKLTSFFVFIGTAMSITAFPVLARILKEGGLIYSRAGALVMGAAALNDAIAWCLLILAISIANSKNAAGAAFVFLLVAAFAGVLFFGIRPYFERLVMYVESLNSRAMNSNLFAFTLMCVFFCAWMTAMLGLDAIFGAFLFGLIIPRGTLLFKECNEYIEELVLTFTLPLYFALSGLKTDVTKISTGPQGAMIILVCFIASIGKFVGCGGAAYFSGMSIRESCTVAVLMNTRGLVELIVLNLGMESGILSVKTFSVMVIMCLFTTFITCPLVEYIYPPHLRVAESDSHEEEAHDEVISDMVEGNEDINRENLLHLSKEFNLGVVIDRLDELVNLISLVACFIPTAESSVLRCTAIKFEEPSKTINDEFIGLNEKDRLIQVEEESQIYDTSMNADAQKGASTRLLPLSVFCRAMGIAVNSYHIRGDPNEFPVELKTITNSFGCGLVIMPWRASPYIEKLFWGSYRKVASTIALYVRKVPQSTTPAPVARRSSITGKQPNVYTYRENKNAPAVPKIHSAVAIISNSKSDIVVLSSCLRFLEKPYFHVTVLVSSDTKSLQPDVLAALTAFETAVSDKSNATVVRVPMTGSFDLDIMYIEVKRGAYDLCLSSFVAPVSAPNANRSLDAMENNDQTTQTLASGPSGASRRHSLARVAQTIHPDAPSLKEMRSRIGAPEAVVSSSLANPELGSFGSRLHNADTVPHILIYHETQGNSAVKRQMNRASMAFLGVTDIAVEMVNFK